MASLFYRIVLIAGLTFPAWVSAQWITRASSPAPRGAPCSCTLGGMVYMFGGNPGAEVGTSERYNPLTDTWTTLAPMAPRSYCGAAAGTNGKIYVIGGHFGGVWLTTVQEYDPGTNTWTNKAPIPVGRMGLCAVAFGDKIYAYGGWNGTNLTSCYEYNTITDTWTLKAPMVQGRNEGAGAELNGLLYCVGGYVASTVGTTEAYNPLTDTWTTRASLAQPRYLHGAASYNGMVLAIAGYSGGALTSVEGYNPATNTWAAQPVLPGTARYQITATNTSTCVYALAGRTSIGAVGTNQEICFSVLSTQEIFLHGEYNAEGLNLNWNDDSGEPGEYSIESSDDGITFEKESVLVGSTETNYHFHIPGIINELKWYRIRKVNSNGTEKISNQIEIAPLTTGPTFSILEVEPGEFLWLEFDGITGPKVEFEIMDPTGKSISTFEMNQPPPGKHIIAMKFPVSSGVYLVSMVTAEKRMARKFAF